MKDFGTFLFFLFSSKIMSARACKSCGSVLGRHTVNKEGPNKGRAFYSCPNNQTNVLCAKEFDWETPLPTDKKFGAFSRSSQPAATGAVGAGFMTEATGQEILKKLDFIAAQVTPTVAAPMQQ